MSCLKILSTSCIASRSRVFMYMHRGIVVCNNEKPILYIGINIHAYTSTRTLPLASNQKALHRVESLVIWSISQPITFDQCSFQLIIVIEFSFPKCPSRIIVIPHPISSSPPPPIINRSDELSVPITVVYRHHLRNNEKRSSYNSDHSRDQFDSSVVVHE